MSFLDNLGAFANGFSTTYGAVNGNPTPGMGQSGSGGGSTSTNAAKGSEAPKPIDYIKAAITGQQLPQLGVRAIGAAGQQGYRADGSYDPNQEKADASKTTTPTKATTQQTGYQRNTGGSKLSGNKQQFIDMMMPHALKASEATGVDPRIIVAQGALETGWGKSAPNNNYFGIKSHGKSGGSSQTTTEYVNGKPVTVQDSFRGYADPGASVQDYADFITANPRYEGFRAADGLDAQISELGKSGYATDPAYASKIGSIAHGIPMPSVSPPAMQTTDNSNLILGAVRGSL
ncbi:hypothetical protein BMI86_10320 [Thioclava sp. DLFJ5-1]|uniref:glycoside hydrolase family 73 protein n=1 Tax=Thioclava sp. DLFJ5-1 TaxID=1915314 RepID=UPI000996F7A0|nr:glucosaminidase domain-containing protein [Thioclava sp. DLFJ5-1]OOY20891.1 hypothetical protein BMI86_10320 [Thioclava sp. DLFJ5-1]